MACSVVKLCTFLWIALPPLSHVLCAVLRNGPQIVRRMQYVFIGGGGGGAAQIGDDITVWYLGVLDFEKRCGGEPPGVQMGKISR